MNRYDKHITDLERRVSNTVMTGKIMAVDHEKGRYRVKSGDLESDWLPMASPRAGKTSIYSSFEEGEQVIMASPSGDLSQAVIVAAVATGDTQAADKGNIHRIKYPDGTTVDYDHDSHGYKMSIAEGGSFEMSLSGGASIHASGDGLTMKAPGRVTIESGELFHNEKNIGDTHEHTDVQPGPANTGPPA